MSQQLTNQSAYAPPTSTEIEEGLLHKVVAGTPSESDARTLPRYANGIATGHLAGIGDDGSPLVNITAWGLRSIPARTLAPVEAARIGEAVALGFESGDPLRPIILGFMLAPSAMQTPPVIERGPELAMDALIDGERVVLHAEHEIELRCGDAALILSADGRIQLRGTYITSYASATQRILGGSVNVN